MSLLETARRNRLKALASLQHQNIFREVEPGGERPVRVSRRYRQERPAVARFGLMLA